MRIFWEDALGGANGGAINSCWSNQVLVEMSTLQKLKGVVDFFFFTNFRSVEAIKILTCTKKNQIPFLRESFEKLFFFCFFFSLLEI